MQFTFKRDEEGHERIYVGDVCVAMIRGDAPADEARIERWLWVNHVHRVHDGHVVDAIERADEAGFWEACNTCLGYDCGRRYDVVTVDVPVAETSIVVVREGDE